MTNFEFAILVFIHQNGSAAWSEVLRHFPVEQIRDTDRSLFKLLDDDHFLEKTLPYDRNRHCRLRLTQQGFHAFCVKAEQLQKDESIRQENIRAEQAQEQKRLDQIVADKAYRRSERRADRIFQIFLSFLNYLIPVILGALFSNLDRIIPWFLELFTH